MDFIFEDYAPLWEKFKKDQTLHLPFERAAVIGREYKSITGDETPINLSCGSCMPDYFTTVMRHHEKASQKPEKPKKDQKKEDNTDLSKIGYFKLISLAREKGIKVPRNINKKDLIKILTEGK